MLGLDSRRLFKKSSAFKKIIRNKYLLESLTPLTSCSEIETYPVEVVSLAYSGNELGRNVLTSKVPHRDLNYTAPRCHRMLHADMTAAWSLGFEASKYPARGRSSSLLADLKLNADFSDRAAVRLLLASEASGKLQLWQPRAPTPTSASSSKW